MPSFAPSLPADWHLSFCLEKPVEAEAGLDLAMMGAAELDLAPGQPHSGPGLQCSPSRPKAWLSLFISGESSWVRVGRVVGSCWPSTGHPRPRPPSRGPTLPVLHAGHFAQCGFCCPHAGPLTATKSSPEDSSWLSQFKLLNDGNRAGGGESCLDENKTHHSFPWNMLELQKHVGGCGKCKAGVIAPPWQL